MKLLIRYLQVLKNAKALCSGLQNLGYKIVTDGTEVHLVLVDLKSTGLTGSKVEFILEEINIACNKNSGMYFFHVLLLNVKFVNSLTFQVFLIY